MQIEREKQKSQRERPPRVGEVPEEIEAKEGTKATVSQFTAKVKSDDGQQLTQSPKTKKVTIELPVSEETLDQMSKGSVDESLTWWAIFWKRIIQKALHFGWKIVGRNPVDQTP